MSASPLCIFCRREVDAWEPWPGGHDGLSPFIRAVGTIGSNLDRLFCPHCRSFDRERHLRLYLERSDAMRAARGGATLHVAPTPHLKQFVQSQRFERYICGDLEPSDPSIERLDVMKLPYPAAAFDLVICNHVLEHVADENRALSEIHRVLRPGARLICQTPYASRLSRTFEDPLLQSSEDRFFFYGSEAHVRLFGADIAELLRAAGFVGRLVPHQELLPDVDPQRVGVNEQEPFFDFVRDASQR